MGNEERLKNKEIMLKTQKSIWISGFFPCGINDESPKRMR